MLQHLTCVYELSLTDFMRLVQGVVIEGKAEGPPNIDQLTVVQKKNLKNINNYGIILTIRSSSLNYGIFTIQTSVQTGTPPSARFF